jgi:hypothetical protein
MTTLRRTLVLFGATAAIAVGAIVVASVVTHGDDSPSPQHTVRDFLLDAVVDHDGMDACAYASSRSLQRLQATAPRGMSCVTAVADHAELTLGGERIATEAAVKALTYRAERQADGGERVTVSVHGDSRSFLLRRATQNERVEFEAPHTPWRIDAGFVELIAR